MLGTKVLGFLWCLAAKALNAVWSGNPELADDLAHIALKLAENARYRIRLCIQMM